MVKKNKTSKALTLSIVAMILCVAMLAGTTFAWFTDSATSSGNKIVAGNLDVQLLMWNGIEYVDISENSEPIFGSENSLIAQNNNANTLWEPGKTQVAYLAIKNNGNLDLNYKVELNVTSVTNNLNKVMQYVITPDAHATEKPVEKANLDFTKANVATEGTQLVGNETALAEAGTTHYFALSIHMMETAGNEYKNGTIDFDLTVHARQMASEEDSFGPDYDKDAKYAGEVGKAEELLAALEKGGYIKLVTDIESGAATIPAGVTVTLDLNNNTLEATATYLQNEGTATINNGTIIAGSASDYSNITVGENAKTTYNDVTVTSAGGGIGAADGAEVIFNSGSVEVNTSSTSGRYLFYAEGAGTKITINGGEFADFTKTSQNQKRAYIYAGEGTTVYVNGGTFGKASTRDGYTAGILGDGDVIITGGTFGFDPSSWVADGYQAVKAGNTYYVVPDGAAVVSNSTELVAAINAGNTKIYLLAGTFEFDWENRAQLNGVTIIGTSAEDSTLQFTGYGPDANGWSLNGLTLENVTVVDRCKPENNTYSYYHSYFYVSGLKATNVVFETGVKTVNDESTFTNCTFVSGYYWNYSTQDYSTEEMYGLVANGNVTVEGCSFTGFRGIDVSAVCVVTVKESTFNVTNTEKDPINMKADDATVTVDGVAQ